MNAPIVRPSVTNLIRTILDDYFPAALRDTFPFMYLPAWIWFKGKRVTMMLRWKELAYSLTEDEFREVYRTQDSLANNRPTDTHPAALALVQAHLDPGGRTLLDVGCGRGHFLSRLAGLDVATHGCDVMEEAPREGMAYTQASAEALPFADNAFDIVTCFHTLEHLRRPAQALLELKRVARRQLIVVVPRQRYFRFTLDLHLNFYPTLEVLAAAMNTTDCQGFQAGQDLVLIVTRPS